MNLTTKNWGVEISWTFGSCESAAAGTYGNNAKYTEQCTLAPGTYTLTCKDTYGDGWNRGYLEIQGTKYCKNFKSGSQKTVQVTVGKQEALNAFMEIWVLMKHPSILL